MPSAQESQKRSRQGSSMSDKQIARAAADQRLVTCRFLSSQPAHEVRGYIVGMDDYKWLIATVSQDGQSVSTALVHKSVDLVLFGPKDSLSSEEPSAAQEIAEIGQAFWSWCSNTYSPQRSTSGGT